VKREDGIPQRCQRCAGSGDISIITPDVWLRPDVRPLLQCCPDCNGSGFERDASDETDVPAKKVARARG